jgi:ribonuclease R
MRAMDPSPNPAARAGGDRPEAADQVRELMRRFGLEPDHPAACNAEARALAASPGLDAEGLVDLEHLPFVTIDNDDSRDLDQALFIEAESGGGHVVWYALADAAWYVRPGSALFAEALRRGASYYLPGRVVPMLPVSLSEGLVSLNEGVPRRALVFRVALDPRAEVLAVEIVRARIRSRRKLSYRLVQALWDGDPALAGEAFAPSLFALRVVGAQRIALAEARDVVRYQRVEVDVAVSDRAGQGFVAFEARRYETDRHNEQISLLVNVEGARLLAARAADGGSSAALQAVFRVHPAPEAADFSALARLTRAVAEAHPRHPGLAWEPDKASLAGWLDGLARQPDELRGVVLALQRQALLLNQRSTFAAAPGLHYGVGAPCYARFTSPMREIVGIFTHKEALEILGLESPDRGDETLREEVILAANRAKELQQQLTKAANQLVIAAMLQADLALARGERPSRPGTVVGLGPDKAYVLLDEPLLELKVYARDLGTRPRLVDDGSVLTVERPGAPELALRLGDRVGLVVTGHDAARDRFTLALS